MSFLQEQIYLHRQEQLEIPLQQMWIVYGDFMTMLERLEAKDGSDLRCLPAVASQTVDRNREKHVIDGRRQIFVGDPEDLRETAMLGATILTKSIQRSEALQKVDPRARKLEQKTLIRDLIMWLGARASQKSPSGGFFCTKTDQIAMYVIASLLEVPIKTSFFESAVYLGDPKEKWSIDVAFDMVRTIVASTAVVAKDIPTEPADREKARKIHARTSWETALQHFTTLTALYLPQIDPTFHPMKPKECTFAKKLQLLLAEEDEQISSFSESETSRHGDFVGHRHHHHSEKSIPPASSSSFYDVQPPSAPTTTFAADFSCSDKSDLRTQSDSDHRSSSSSCSTSSCHSSHASRGFGESRFGSTPKSHSPSVSSSGGKKKKSGRSSRGRGKTTTYWYSQETSLHDDYDLS